MQDWLNPWSFVLGMIVGGGLAAAGFVIRLQIKVSRSGPTSKVTQKNINASGDVVGRDKVTKSEK